jgi:hypothetical protein
MDPATADRITRIIAHLVTVTSTRAIAGAAVGVERATLALAATPIERLAHCRVLVYCCVRIAIVLGWGRILVIRGRFVWEFL